MTVDDITLGVMVLVRVGVVGRFIFCMVKLIGAEEEAGRYKKRARNAVIFWIIAESIWVLRDLVLHYYS